jgi:hypothetical protein
MGVDFGDLPILEDGRYNFWPIRKNNMFCSLGLFYLLLIKDKYELSED